ncbi:MAG: metallophosphoesterase family protein, partial [Acidimicrobiia bacterium]
EYRNCYEPSWGRHKARTRPVVGNHEYGTSGAAGYFGYFGTAAGTAGEGFYSYDLGAWHVVVLNSNCGAVSCSVGSAQEKWLRADLAASQAACTVALWHHPRFSSGSHGNDLSVQPLWNALYEYGAELVLNGHDHTYERFAPQRPDGTLDNAHGIREFVIGTGGRPLYSFNAIKPNSEARNNTVFGVLRLTLRSGSYDFRFVPEAGGTYTDSGSASCHGRP